MGSCSASPLGRLVEETTVSSIFFSFWFLVSGLCFRVWSYDFRILGVYWPLVAVNSRPPETSKYPHLTLCSQILVLPPDTAKNGRTLLSVPKHSQTSQDAAKTLGSVWHHAGPKNYTKMLRSIFWAPESRARAISEGKVSRISRSIRSTGLRFQVGGWRQGAKPLDYRKSFNLIAQTHAEGKLCVP